MASPSGPSTPPPPPQEPEDDSDTSSLSDPPSELFSPSPLVTKQPRQVSPSPIPKGYRINSITGSLMVDPKSRDYVANFRAMYHPDVDFSSGRYIDEGAYAVSVRHVPPNVPKESRPLAAPLGLATKGDVDRYRGPNVTPKRAEDAVKEEQEPASVKLEVPTSAKRPYPFHEDESWAASLAKTPKRNGKEEADGVVDCKEEDEGDTTLTDPAMSATPPVKNFRIR
ncbi:hypothetical protein M409DRAFT_24469 [Zasmidium cellare ATCC 36951]|uniref:Uncharacterized protein n=1 Tax=Zasmidium cellare ATCC 36951 TaxID=1080233 RepID=A0A6A6CDF8_ZASCE|nr:uncharacterized protein M409DRAFT_24469 [Zasmidium cellare ATCC 36951]KAF2165081.1 hypothetical protein M409DRAFT_24469 [Zasmidium cellare ATCC 36951]